jgi:hypothetical protein
MFVNSLHVSSVHWQHHLYITTTISTTTITTHHKQP